MYQLINLVHILAVIIFMGNIITGLFWKWHADRTGDARLMAHTMRGIIKSDRWFTIPGAVVITVAGFFAAIRGGLPLLGTGWILWSAIAFTLSGLIFGIRVAPLQKHLLMVASTDDASFDRKLYRSSSLQWEIWAFFATALPLLAVVMMVLKRPA